MVLVASMLSFGIEKSLIKCISSVLCWWSVCCGFYFLEQDYFRSGEGWANLGAIHWVKEVLFGSPIWELNELLIFFLSVYFFYNCFKFSSKLGRKPCCLPKRILKWFVLFQEKSAEHYPGKLSVKSDLSPVFGE